jgi:hypothetical protein
MKKPILDRDAGHRYSVRTSITLWMLLAGVIWATLGFAVTYASHWGGNSLEAEARRLSKIAPAAGSPPAAPQQ